tara:strand:- start:815 stop:1234 length:420 start_codon:yes stop_codon:yes gene_type:complete
MGQDNRPRTDMNFAGHANEVAQLPVTGWKGAIFVYSTLEKPEDAEEKVKSLFESERTLKGLNVTDFELEENGGVTFKIRDVASKRALDEFFLACPEGLSYVVTDNQLDNGPSEKYQNYLGELGADARRHARNSIVKLEH